MVSARYVIKRVLNLLNPTFLRSVASYDVN